jgi:hypothetical protein
MPDTVRIRRKIGDNPMKVPESCIPSRLEQNPRNDVVRETDSPRLKFEMRGKGLEPLLRASAAFESLSLGANGNDELRKCRVGDGNWISGIQPSGRTQQEDQSTGEHPPISSAHVSILRLFRERMEYLCVPRWLPPIPFRPLFGQERTYFYGHKRTFNSCRRLSTAERDSARYGSLNSSQKRFHCVVSSATDAFSER